MRFGQTSNA